MSDHNDSLTYERFELAKEATDLGVWEWKEDEDELIWDDRTIELFGFSPFGGMEQFLKAVHPEDRDAVRTAVNEAVENGDPFHHRYRIQKNGDTCWIEAYGKWVEREGQQDRLIGTVRDVTEEMTRKKELEIFRRTMDQNPDGLYVIDSETACILDVTEETEEILGYSREELLSMRVHDIDPGVGQEFKWEQLVDRIIQDGPITLDTYHQCKDGKTFPVEIHADYEVLDGSGKIIATCRDITERKEQERQLREERERFRQVAEKIREVFWLTPPDKSEMLFISPAYEEVWGRSREDLQRNPEEWLDAIHPDDRDRVRDALPGQRRGDYEEEYRIKRPDGEIRWIRDRAYPIRDENGEVVRLVGVAEDITERKEMETSLRKSEKMYRTLFEEAREGFLIQSVDDQVLKANQSACDALGYAPDELEGMTVDEITPPEFRKKCEGQGIVRYQLDQQGTGLYNWHYLHKDGSKIPVTKSMSPIEYGGSDAVLVCMREQSELRRLRKQSQRKSSFVTQVTHDLRTPLNSITGMSNLLMDTELTGEQKNFIQTILNASRNMERLTNDIIDLNRIERGELILEDEPFDIQRLLGDVISMYGHKGEEQDVITSTDVSENVPNRLIGDPDRLKQILYNLMDNAMKNTQKGYIQLKVEPLDQEEDSVTLSFSVSDTGSGIPESKQESIFQPHTQIENDGAGSPPGLGIGLSICRNLVEQMGGEITVQSEVGKGSTFSFSIELEIAGEEDEFPTVSLNEVNALLVEDNSLTRKVFLEYFDSHGINAEECGTGEEALEKLTDDDGTAYDVVFMDHRLDGMTGVEVLEKVTDSETGIDPERIYIYSGDPSEKIEQLIGSLPHAGVLEKPVEEVRLINAVSFVVQLMSRQADDKENIDLQEEIRAQKSDPLQILVADDDQNTRTLLNELLSPITEELTFVVNGEEALQKRFDITPDLILMDLEMPEMSGREATETIRMIEEEQDLPHVPIIVQTAKAMKHVETKCLKAGANTFVRKPIKKQRLYRSILEVFS